MWERLQPRCDCPSGLKAFPQVEVGCGKCIPAAKVHGLPGFLQSELLHPVTQ